VKIPAIKGLTHNQLVELRHQVNQALIDGAHDLIGQTVVVPDWLVDDTTPDERRVAKVLRINRTKRELPNVSIAPGGNFGGASMSLGEVRTA
jgi:hypothetical protein